MGSSQPWPEAMKVLTGQPKMSASAILEYFQPLYEYLQVQNAGECFGWNADWPPEVLRTLPQPRCDSTLSAPPSANVKAAVSFLVQTDRNSTNFWFEDVLAQWTYQTNVTDANSELQAKKDSALTQFQIENAEYIKNNNLSNGINQTFWSRQLKKLGTVGIRLDATDTCTLSTYISQMIAVYNKATICAYVSPNKTDCSVQWTFDDDIVPKLAESTDYDEQAYIWNEWRHQTGPAVAPTYEKFVALSNKGAQADGFADTGDWWRSSYEDPKFQDKIEQLWYQVLPLYEQLHAYTRDKLKKERYPGKFDTNTIPAHIFGNMWSQDWTNLYPNFLIPFPNKASVDVTHELVNQNYTSEGLNLLFCKIFEKIFN